MLSRLDSPQWRVNVSTPLLLEYEDVLKRLEMHAFITPADVDVFLDGLCSIAKNHDIYFLWRLLATDPNDAFILELAVRSSADYLITYNQKDFLAAREFGVKLATPREFMEIVGVLK